MSGVGIGVSADKFSFVDVVENVDFLGDHFEEIVPENGLSCLTVSGFYL